MNEIFSYPIGILALSLSKIGDVENSTNYVFKTINRGALKLTCSDVELTGHQAKNSCRPIAREQSNP